jgi:hypothetical protein
MLATIIVIIYVTTINVLLVVPHIYLVILIFYLLKMKHITL